MGVSQLRLEGFLMSQQPLAMALLCWYHAIVWLMPLQLQAIHATWHGRLQDGGWTAVLCLLYTGSCAFLGQELQPVMQVGTCAVATWGGAVCVILERSGSLGPMLQSLPGLDATPFKTRSIRPIPCKA